MDAHKTQNIQAWNDRARGYDVKGWGRLTRQVVARVLGALEAAPYGSVLDVGCGTGTLLEVLRDRGGVRLAGIDLSPEMIRVAREKLGESVDLRVGDAEALPWENGSFAVVTSTISFHHYPHPVQALREMRRVLVPEGRLVLADAWLPPVLRQIMNLLLPLGREGDVKVYSRPEVGTFLVAAGFRPARWEIIGGLAYLVVARPVQRFEAGPRARTGGRAGRPD